jgi:hypothetical protein
VSSLDLIFGKKILTICMSRLNLRATLFPNDDIADVAIAPVEIVVSIQ